MADETTTDAPAMPPWHQLDDETDRAYSVFRWWLENLPRGERLLSRAAEHAGHRATRTVETWSGRYDWPGRARAYDEHLDDAADSAAVEQREELMRQLVRDRVAYQRDFHRQLERVSHVLGDIAEDDEAPANSRVNAVRLLIEQSGYKPAAPPEEDKGVDEIVVAELLRMAAVLPPAEGETFTRLALKASDLLEAQRNAGSAHEVD